MSCKLRLFRGLWDSGGLNEKLGQNQSSVLSGKRKGGEVKGPLVKSLSPVRLFATTWTVAYQAPPSMGFSMQEYWSGLPFPSPKGPLPELNSIR